MPQLKELEKIFSANSHSPVFPMLANIYYQKKLYKYAVKICKLGLNQDPDNLEGLYILAKTLLMQGEIEKAERVLKNILSTLKTAFFKQNTINNDSVPTGDTEFIKVAKEATVKMHEIENAAGRA